LRIEGLSGHRMSQPFCDPFRIAERDARHANRELLAANAAKRIGTPHDLGKAISQAAEHSVADSVAFFVVNLFEVVHVD
jgi:hypothetical protein